MLSRLELSDRIGSNAGNFFIPGHRLQVFCPWGPNSRVRGGRIKPKAGRQVGELTHGKDGDDEGHVKVTADEPHALNEGKRETATIDYQINSADGGRSFSREIKAPWQFAPNAQLTTSVSPREQIPAAS